MAGSVVFGDPEGARFSAALPLVSELQSSLLFAHVASDDTYFTGLAVLNPNQTEAKAVIELFSSDGALQASVNALIPAGQRKARVLTELFPSMIGENQTSGYIRVTADMPLAGFALFGTNDLSVLSAVPPQEVNK